MAYRVQSALTHCFLCAVLFLSWSICSTENKNGMSADFLAGDFQGVQVVTCSVAVTNELAALNIYDSRNITSALVSMSLLRGGVECQTGYIFSLCYVNDAPNQAVIKVIITNLQENETRTFGCKATYLRSGNTFSEEHIINITGAVETTTYAFVTLQTTTEIQLEAGESTGTENPETGFQLSLSVLIICAFLLAIFFILSIVLIILQIRARRGRRYRSADCDSFSFKAGLGGGREGFTDPEFVSLGAHTLTRVHRHTSANTGYCPAPTTTAPDVPTGNRLVMQYQRPLPLGDKSRTNQVADDTGYFSESSGHPYQEPWGRLDEEINEKLSSLRPVSRMCHIPGFAATSPPQSQSPLTSSEATA